MKRTILIALVTAILTIPAFAAERILPVVGSVVGANGSNWQTEMSLHNSGMDPVDLTLVFHGADGTSQSATLTLDPRQTKTFGNVVLDLFGRSTAAGALVVKADDVAVRKIAVNARTFTGAGPVQYGQDVPVYDPTTQALGDGDTGVIAGPIDPLSSRFNFGIYAIDATTIEWDLVRSDGSIAASVQANYTPGAQVQYNGGVSTLLGSTSAPGDVVYARVRSGRAIVYGSVINQATNDPSFVEFSPTRENIPPVLAGVDANEDGTIDIQDANHDGILDSPIMLATFGIPNFFRIVVTDPEGHPVTLSIKSQRNDVRLVDDNGTIEFVPNSYLKGGTDTLLVDASDGTDTVTFSLPVIYR